VLARQTLRVSTTIRSGDREIVRVRPFVRGRDEPLAGALLLASNVPPFNPVKLMAEADPEERPDDIPQAEPGGDLTIVMRDLAMVPASAASSARCGPRRHDETSRKRSRRTRPTESHCRRCAQQRSAASSAAAWPMRWKEVPLRADDIPATFENMKLLPATKRRSHRRK